MSHLASYSNQRVLDKYTAWDRANPDFYPEFARFSKQLLDRGHSRISAALVFERIRWEGLVSTTGDEFKINDNFRAVYARRFMDDYPKYGEAFQLKVH